MQPGFKRGSQFALAAHAGSTPALQETAEHQTHCILFQGNTTGDVYVYNTSDGNRMTHVAPIKVSAPVRACGLSPDCRHLLAVVGNGFIFRFEYRRPNAQVCCMPSVQCRLAPNPTAAMG